MLVGTAAAKEPEWQRVSVGNRGALRGDVYQAFTRVVEVPFVYSPDSDRFLSEDVAEGRTIRVPEITVDTLILDRRQFAESLDPQSQESLLDALSRSPNPVGCKKAVRGKLGSAFPTAQGQRHQSIGAIRR